MKTFKIIFGDVTSPIGDGKKLICHIVNDQGLMGSGVAKALFDKWPIVRHEYIRWYNECQRVENKDFFNLGDVQFVVCEPNIYVANMVAQHMVGSDEFGNPPIRYDALNTCLRYILKVGIKALRIDSIHIPYKMGADRAGGDWNKIVKMLENTFCKNGISVTAYKWNG